MCKQSERCWHWGRHNSEEFQARSHVCLHSVSCVCVCVYIYIYIQKCEFFVCVPSSSSPVNGLTVLKNRAAICRILCTENTFCQIK